MVASGAVAGDFGRPDSRPSFFSAPAAPLGGRFNDTDQEREMHDRIWRFLQPPRKGAGRHVPDYYVSLSRAEFASSRVRYRAVGDDVAADLGTLPGTFSAICAVADVDRQRAIALNGLPGMEAGMHNGVGRARDKNAAEIARFVAALRFRYESYSYAVDHLLVETPHADVIAVDAQLGEMEAFVREAEREEFCTEDRHRRRPPPDHAGAPIDLMGS